MSLLTITGLAKAFTLHHQGKTIPSVARADAVVEPGRLTALVGPSGAGKSTVLKCVWRTYLPQAGRILFDTGAGVVDLAAADEHTVLGLRARHIAFVTQFLHCLPRQPTRDVVAQPLWEQGVARAQARAAAEDRLRLFALPERLWDVPPATFSGGERQRVNLARGLVHRPRLLLLDEPTASLDRRSAALVIEAIRVAKAEGVGILAIFHDPELVATLADTVVELQSPAAEAA